MSRIKSLIALHKIGILLFIFLAVGASSVLAGSYNLYQHNHYLKYNTVTLNKEYSENHDKVVQLGKPISVDPSTYIDADYDVTGIAVVDTSKVNIYSVGTYPLYITCGKQTKKINIKIVDTVAPTIKLATQKTYQAKGTALMVSKIVSSIRELSGHVTFEFLDGNYSTSNDAVKTINGVKFTDVGVKFQDTGERSVELKVTDESGNSSSVSFVVVTTGAPALEGLRDISVEQGTEATKIDLLTGVKALDEVDGDISSKIKVDSSTVDTSKVGDYVVKYSVKNSMDAVGTGDRTIHVTEKKAETDKASVNSKKKASKSESGSEPSATSPAATQSSQDTGALQSVSLVGTSMGCEAEVVQYVNNERTAAGLQPVTESPVLDKLAAIRAGETVSLFSHTRPDGRTCFAVFSDYGVTYRGAGENIAAGHQNANQVMYMNEDANHIGWMYSPGHKANIMNSSYTKIGVAARYVEGSAYKYYWCQLFSYD